ncbi:MAG TPA: sterol desaturase family protein [Thermoanaerobaculia bacterium]|nr:sterol desaturase family protein [Thermoanaerobaculia bacterium]
MKKWLTPIVFGAAFVAIAVAERKRPLRRRVEAKRPRMRQNFAMAGLTTIVTGALQKPLVERALDAKGGLLRRLPRPVRFVAGILLLDYTLWVWHWLNHVFPPLWRFHVVHHLDRDLDVSTAVRFHFGEMALAALFRAAQVRVIGVDRDALVWWQRMLLVSILFHHSNLELPSGADARLVRVFVTPRMHGIHHSDRLEETNSNWASLFTWWDMLHRTFVYGVPQDSITIGAPGRAEAQPTFGELLALPFRFR